MVVVGGISHGYGDLDLPVGCAGLDYGVHQLGQMRHRLGTDLRVDAGFQAGSLGAPQRIERTGERTWHSADAIVQTFRAVKRNPDSLQSDRKSTRLNSSHRCISYA